MNYNKLKGLMREKNISQSKLAELVGISEVALNQKLNGKTQFRTDEIIKIAKVLDIGKKIQEFFFAK